jgi:hypothetical protein
MPSLWESTDRKRQCTDVPEMRNQTVRNRTKTVNRKRGSRNGISARVAHDMASRLKNVRALWFTVQNDPRYSIEDVAAEFYFAVGELLEGKGLSAITLRSIDRLRVLAHAEE